MLKVSRIWSVGVPSNLLLCPSDLSPFLKHFLALCYKAFKAQIVLFLALALESAIFLKELWFFFAENSI